MNKDTQIVWLPIAELVPYEHNAKEHTQTQIRNIKKSLTDYGWQNPCLITKDNVLIAGHGRIMAAKELGLKEAPCICADDMTEEQIREYRHLDNLLSEGGYIDSEMQYELQTVDLSGYDFSEINTEIQGVNVPPGDWFENRERWDNSREEGNEEYNEFLEKFEAKHTTDDCYTPDNIYEAVCEWVEEEYGVNRKNFVRPFYPNGDYQKEHYKKTDIVVDNPPFSILAEIIKYYQKNDIKFFMFAPGLTVFSSSSCCCICCGATVTYENGAGVCTSFVTNLDEETQARTAPALTQAIKVANNENLAQRRRELQKHAYPDCVISAAMLNYISLHGIDFKVKKQNAHFVRALDEQKESGAAIYGTGFLIAEKAAAEKAAAEKAAAEKAAAMVWKLSERERAIIKSLGAKDE